MLLRATLEQVSHHFVIRRRLPPPLAAARIYTSSDGKSAADRRRPMAEAPQHSGHQRARVGIGLHRRLSSSAS